MRKLHSTGMESCIQAPLGGLLKVFLDSALQETCLTEQLITLTALYACAWRYQVKI